MAAMIVFLVVLLSVVRSNSPPPLTSPRSVDLIGKAGACEVYRRGGVETIVACPRGWTAR